MAVVIRMKRTGRKNAPCYRISVADKGAPRDGRTLDTLGLYDPISPRPELRLKLDVERARKWIQNGAQPSETVHSIFKAQGVYKGIPKKTKKRARPERGRTTATSTTRAAEHKARAEAKVARRSTRLATRRAAAKAAKAAAPAT
jgi:small subunit ribosomal protein S16